MQVVLILEERTTHDCCMNMWVGLYDPISEDALRRKNDLMVVCT